jgi:hypothetical protein
MSEANELPQKKNGVEHSASFPQREFKFYGDGEYLRQETAPYLTVRVRDNSLKTLESAIKSKEESSLLDTVQKILLVLMAASLLIAFFNWRASGSIIIFFGIFYGMVTGIKMIESKTGADLNKDLKLLKGQVSGYSQSKTGVSIIEIELNSRSIKHIGLVYGGDWVEEPYSSFKGLELSQKKVVSKHMGMGSRYTVSISFKTDLTLVHQDSSKSIFLFGRSTDGRTDLDDHLEEAKELGEFLSKKTNLPLEIHPEPRRGRLWGLYDFIFGL